MKKPEQHWRPANVFIVNFKNISLLVLVFPLLTLNRQMPDEQLSCSVIFIAIKMNNKKATLQPNANKANIPKTVMTIKI